MYATGTIYGSLRAIHTEFCVHTLCTYIYMHTETVFPMYTTNILNTVLPTRVPFCVAYVVAFGHYGCIMYHFLVVFWFIFLVYFCFIFWFIFGLLIWGGVGVCVTFGVIDIFGIFGLFVKDKKKCRDCSIKDFRISILGL